MLPRLRPNCFYDLVIEVAIVRPGPIQGNMVHPYLRRRCGEEEVIFPNEALREVLKKTLGVPLFQEQAMRIAMVAAGFSADEADKLRRAMAAWRRTSALEAFHQKIVNGMLANGYEREFAEQCFNQIKGFGEYGFPESHAASFALLVYVSAWLKRYHPAAFAAALINSQPMGFYMPAQIVRDAKEHGVKVLPVDVNRSEWDCILERHEGTEARRHEGTGGEERDRGAEKSSWGIDGPALRLGLRQLKGFREAHAQLIVEARAKLKRFASLEQLHQTTHLPVSALRILAEADTFGSLGLSRREALWEVLELKDGEEGLFEASFIAPSPGTPGEGRGEGDFEHPCGTAALGCGSGITAGAAVPQEITLTPALSRSTGRGGESPEVSPDHSGHREEEEELRLQIANCKLQIWERSLVHAAAVPPVPNLQFAICNLQSPIPPPPSPILCPFVPSPDHASRPGSHDRLRDGRAFAQAASGGSGARGTKTPADHLLQRPG